MPRVGMRWALLAVLVIAALALLVAWPLVELFLVAGEQLGPGIRLPWGAVANTLLVGAGALVVAVTAGAGAAFLTERTAVRGRSLLRVGILLPVLVPPFVSALSWARAYGQGGVVDDLVGLGWEGLYGAAGIILVVAVNAIPLVYVITAAALRTRVETDLELAARVSGASSRAVTTTVTLPLLAPAMVGAAALVFVIGINAFGVPAILGTPAAFDTVTTRIYQDLVFSAQPESFSRALLLASGLVLAALVFAVVAEATLAGLGERRGTGAPAGPVPPLPPAGALPTILVWGLIGLTTIFPLIALVLVAITSGVGLAPTPGNWTLAHFGEALAGRNLAALGRSLLLAGLTATLAVVLGSGVAALRRRRFGRATGVAVLLSFAVPGSTLAVAVLLAYGSLLRDTLLLILIAYLAKLWAVGHRTIAGSVANLPDDSVRAARGSGASAPTTMLTIVVPMLRPALIGGWALVFLIAFHELTMSSLLYGPGTDTLAVAILNLQQLGDVPVSSALAVILTLPLLVLSIPLLVMGRMPRRIVGTG